MRGSGRREDAQPGRTADAHAAGVAITTYFNPMICSNYQPAFGEAAQAGALTETATGDPYLYRYGADVDQAFLVGQFDFFSAAGSAAYAARLDEAIDDGYDGWMEDFGEYTPLDSVSAGQIHGSRAHNPYATRYHCAAFDATAAGPQPIVRFQRSGWTGAAACADVVWGGDPTTAWGFDGLRSAVTQAISAGSSGIGVWGSDIGGFFALADKRLTPELLMRWVQLGAVSPVMRTQANGVALPPKSRPQVTDPDQIDNWRRYTKLHTQLYPYLAGAVDTYRRAGCRRFAIWRSSTPATRPPRRARTSSCSAPTCSPRRCSSPARPSAALYLPRGRWIDLWRSAVYRDRSGGIALRRAKAVRGGREVTVPAPLTELPLLVRAGAVLALLPPKVDTLAEYGRADPEIDTLGETGAGCDCSPSREGAPARPSTTASGCARARPTPAGGWGSVARPSPLPARGNAADPATPDSKAVRGRGRRSTAGLEAVELRPCDRGARGAPRRGPTRRRAGRPRRVRLIRLSSPRRRGSARTARRSHRRRAATRASPGARAPRARRPGPVPLRRRASAHG